jgi:hypothetical protein
MNQLTMFLSVGDEVRHKNMPDELLRVKKIGEGIAVCERIEKEKILSHITHEWIYQVVICRIEGIYTN